MQTHLKVPHLATIIASGALAVVVAAVIAGAATLLPTDRTVQAHDGLQDQDPGVLSFIPRVKSVTPGLSGSDTGPYKAGDIIAYRVRFIHSVMSQGQSRFVIKVGDNHRYATLTRSPKESTEFLVYRYTVREGDLDADGVSVPQPPLDEETGDVDQAALPLDANDQPMVLGMIEFVGCGSIRGEGYLPEAFGQAGYDAIRTLPAAPDDPNHTVDAVPPTVSGVTVNDAPGGGPYGAGDDVVITMTFSEPVTVTGGNPSLSVVVGDQPQTAAFQSQSADQRSMTFAYRVQRGDAAPNGVSVNSDSISLPQGASITDTVGNAAKLTHQAVKPNPKAAVDAAPPAVTGLTVATTGPYGIGDDIRFELSFNKQVTVSGAPILSFRAGTDVKQAAYSQTDGNKVSFTYRVTQGESAPGGLSVDANSVSLPDGANIKGSGLDAAREHDALPANADQAIDGVRPTVTHLQMQGDAKVHTQGDAIAVAATFSEAVSVKGAPSLTVQVGDEARTAAYTGHEGAVVTFAYNLQADDEDANGVSVTAGSIAIPAGGHIRDAVGNDADASHPALADQSGYTVAIPERVLSLALNQGPYKAGDDIIVTASFSGDVTVAGTPTLTIQVGDDTPEATYQASNPQGSAVKFVHRVEAGQEDVDGVSVSTGSISLPDGATITGANGLAVKRGHDGATGDSNHVVDAVAPTISSIAMVGDAETYDAGDTLKVRVTFSEAVTITGTPDLALTVGSQSEAMTYHAHDGAHVDFTYTVQEGDVDADGVSVAAGTLGGATVTDAIGNLADLTHQGMTADSKHKVSAGPAVAGKVSVLGEPKHYGVGDVLSIAVEFDEQVKVSGKPTIPLQVGDTERTAAFQRVSGKDVVFTYTVVNGDNDANGVSVNAGDIALPGNASIVSANNGSSAALSHPAMPDQGEHVVDTRRPEYDKSAAANGFAFVGAGSQPTTFDAGSEIFLLVYFDEPVEVKHKPTMQLNIGGKSRTAEYTADGDRNCVPGTNYCQTLTFRYRVAEGDLDDDGVEVQRGTIRYPGRLGSIKDRAGNKARVDHSGWRHANNPRVDAVVTPELVRVAMVGHKTAKKPGETLYAWAKFNAPVKISGSPALTFRIGHENGYQDVQSEWAFAYNSRQQSGILFRLKVPNGVSDPDGISFPANPITLGAGDTVTSPEGKDAILTLDETEANDGYLVSPTE